MLSTTCYVVILHVVLLCKVSQAVPNNLNRCLQGKHHKVIPGIEGKEFQNYHCLPWFNRSCCTSKTSQYIQEDGALSLYNMKWNHCERNLSKSCQEWFQRDTCFYECSPNMGPWIVADRRSTKTRSERIMNIPLCSQDCDAWFESCKNDLTCSDNWNKNWKWTKEGNTCIQQCKTFKEHFKDSQDFCSNIFDQTFRYTKGTPGKDCFSLWPNVTASGQNPNSNVAKAAQLLQDKEKQKDPKLEIILDRCITSKNHKKTPGMEGEGFSGVCVPWRTHSCCTGNTTKSIKQDGGMSLYRMMWDHCGNLSQTCRDYFVKDTCFYECSPNLAPWIVNDQVSKYTRKERFLNVPLCSADCDGWFEACKDELTCSDNWGQNWNWTKNGNKCNLSCKRFKDYFPDPITFCNNIFNHSFAYTTGKPGEDCMNLWPDSNVKDLNREVAYLAAGKMLNTRVHSGATALHNNILVVSLVAFLLRIF